METPLVVGNWKMNPQSEKEAVKIASSSDRRGVVVCPPFPFLSLVKKSVKNCKIGAQNCFFEKKGPYTGEVSSSMIKGLGCDYVIVGHSERRDLLKEDKEMIKKKIEVVVKEGLTPIICIGEIEENTKGLDYIKEQLSGLLSDYLVKKVIIAYEPVFAIGSGKPCDTEEAEKKKVFIKSILAKNYQKGEIVPILYGGSVNAKNGADYIKKAGFDGLLVGGASIKPKEFELLIKNVFKKI